MMLALHRPDTIFSLRHAPSWLLLTMTAGAVNAGAFLACRRFVTHVTGTVTLLGMDSSNWHLMLDYGIVLGCFIAGAMTSVVAIDGRHHRGKRPLYALPLLVVAAILFAVSVLGSVGAFGEFGGSAEQLPDFAMLSLVSFAMGLQNAAVATSTGSVVRTTHLTGPATDLGIHLANCLLTEGDPRMLAARHALLRVGKIVGFATGAALMVPVAQSLGYLAFLMPAVFVLGATALSFVAAWSALGTDAPDEQYRLTMPAAATAVATIDDAGLDHHAARAASIDHR